MEEVGAWLGGESDYSKIRGGTGPLVYPAGFLYLYGALRWVSGDSGALASPGSLERVQLVFLFLYLATHWIVLKIMGWVRRGPPAVGILLVLSYRLHSLYTLRLFNDCWAMLGVYSSVALACQGHWLLSVLAWSSGVSVKMNGLLILPALGVLLLRNTGPLRTTLYLGAAILLQALLALPFLSTFPLSYLSKAFELGRGCAVGTLRGDSPEDKAGLFLHRWSVNWAFLPPNVFVSSWWQRLLLGLHLSCLFYLSHCMWCPEEGGLPNTLWKVWRRFTSAFLRTSAVEKTREGQEKVKNKRSGSKPPNTPPPKPVTSSTHDLWTGEFTDSSRDIATSLLVCNFVGLVFAKSLHWQFYAWYAHSLPVVAWAGATLLPNWARLVALLAVDYGFSAVGGSPDGVGDKTQAFQSVLINVGHFLLLLGVLASAWRGGTKAQFSV